MKFALGMPALILYPPIMSPWEPQASGQDVLRVARKADEAGWDWLTISEHIVMPNDMAEVMGPRFPESLTAASVIAGATCRVKLLTYVLVLGYRHPVFLAKQIATLDFLSEGRVLLGAGIGHMQGEFEALGAPFKGRGSMADESILAMRELWGSPQPSFDGKHFRFHDVTFEPKPVQKPYPPVFVGGNSKAAMRRAARLGDGWLPWLVTREQLPDCLNYIAEQPEFEQRRQSFEVVMPLVIPNVEDYSHRELGETRQLGNREEIVEEIGLLRDAGVTVVQVPPPRTPSVEFLLEWVEWFAREVVPVFRQ
jgi:probable F420-dependent oxidoreductase